MEKYLITQSLLGSYSYMFECAEGYEEDAKASFLSTLNREPGRQTEAMSNGIEFENLVYSIAGKSFKDEDNLPRWYNGAKSVASFINNAPVQVKLSRDIDVCGMKFVVYGILDSLKCGTIFDVKFKNKSFGGCDLAGSYLNSPQHPAYFYLCPEAHQFVYLVSDGSDLYTETYSRENTRFIGDLIKEFIEGITSMGLLEVFKEKWVSAW